MRKTSSLVFSEDDFELSNPSLSISNEHLVFAFTPAPTTNQSSYLTFTCDKTIRFHTTSSPETLLDPHGLKIETSFNGQKTITSVSKIH